VKTETLPISILYRIDSRTRIIRLLPHRVVNTKKSARHSTRSITFIAPLPTSPVDVQTAEPTRGDTSIVSQSVTNNRCAPHVGAQEKSGGTSKKKIGRHGIVPPTCKLLPTPLLTSVAHIGPNSRTARPDSRTACWIRIDAACQIRMQKRPGFGWTLTSQEVGAGVPHGVQECSPGTFHRDFATQFLLKSVDVCHNNHTRSLFRSYRALTNNSSVGVACNQRVLTGKIDTPAHVN